MSAPAPCPPADALSQNESYIVRCNRIIGNWYIVYSFECVDLNLYE